MGRGCWVSFLNPTYATTTTMQTMHIPVANGRAINRMVFLARDIVCSTMFCTAQWARFTRTRMRESSPCQKTNYKECAAADMRARQRGRVQPLVRRRSY
jgi:hypothetical protein